MIKLPIREDSLGVLSLTILILVTLGNVFTVLQWRAFRDLQDTIEEHHFEEIKTTCDYCQVEGAAEWVDAFATCKEDKKHLTDILDVQLKANKECDDNLSDQFHMVDCCWDAFDGELTDPLAFSKPIAYFKKECWKTVYGSAEREEDK